MHWNCKIYTSQRLIVDFNFLKSLAKVKVPKTFDPVPRNARIFLTYKKYIAGFRIKVNRASVHRSRSPEALPKRKIGSRYNRKRIRSAVLKMYASGTRRVRSKKKRQWEKKKRKRFDRSNLRCYSAKRWICSSARPRRWAKRLDSSKSLPKQEVPNKRKRKAGLKALRIMASSAKPRTLREDR